MIFGRLISVLAITFSIFTPIIYLFGKLESIEIAIQTSLTAGALIGTGNGIYTILVTDWR